ncbi:MAG TPA: phospholipase D-like domain-containing protein [Steroidobacteraceae bacterium]|nr:phospholipase D-like domain-containing protein [Steroidobacteraceae bacterium]
MKKPAPRVWLEVAPAGNKGLAKFIVRFSGLPAGSRTTLEFFEIPPSGQKRHRSRQQSSGDIKLGAVTGTIVKSELASQLSGTPTFFFQPDALPPQDGGAGDGVTQATTIEVVLPGTNNSLFFSLPHEAQEVDEGDWWEIQVRCDSPAMRSKPALATRMRRGVEKTSTRYHWHRSHKLTLYHDGATDAVGTAGAFADIVAAIEAAQHFVFVVDWSFQPLFRPKLPAATSANPLAETIGALLLRKSQDLTVAIHTWDHTTHFAKDSQNDHADRWLQRINTQLGLSGKVSWRAGSPSGLSYSHHQKFVLVDHPASDGRIGFKVFFGGLDLTKGRLDWPGHSVSRHDQQLMARTVSWGAEPTNDWYNAETDGNLKLPRQAWHDIYACVEGPATWDFMREFVIRWGKPFSGAWENGDALQDQDDPVSNVWKKVCDHNKWVQQDDGTAVYGGPWSAQVVRSNMANRCGVPDELLPLPRAVQLQRAVPDGFEASILESYRLAIDQAEHFIYIENQYLIGSGKNFGEKGIANDIPERLVKKILDKKTKGAAFHVYVVTPMFPEGSPVTIGGIEVRKNEFETMRYIICSIGTGWESYISFFFLADWHTAPSTTWSNGDRDQRLERHQRYMVYVHSKLMIVDDRFVILGSANLNERSLSGKRDTEIACAFWPGRNEDGKCTEQVTKFRQALFTEHFGSALPGNPSSPGCWRHAQAIGASNYIAFRTLSAPPTGHACRMPAKIEKDTNLSLGVPSTKELEKPLSLPDNWNTIPDAPAGKKLWMWQCRGSYMHTGDAAE